jgi:hypothetical protein
MKWTVLAFVAGAALSWGVYVPTVHEATAKLGSNLRAFLMVGLAYFLTAVLIPGFFIFVMKSDPTVKPGTEPNWASPHMMWGIAAGTAGAIGALCVIFAVKAAGPGAAIYVAPLVFAGAPIINTIASMTVFAHGKKTGTPNAMFFLGLLMAAGGAALVMLNKPKPAAPAPTPAATSPAEADSGN